MIIFFSFQEADSELGQTGAAGLASVETLDDSAGELKPIVNEDGMETVRLDGEDGADGAAPGPKHPLICITALRKHMVASGTKTYDDIQHANFSKQYQRRLTANLISIVYSINDFDYARRTLIITPEIDRQWRPC